MLINSGIDEGVEVCNRHSSTVMHVLDEMMNTDTAERATRSDSADRDRRTRVAGEADRRVGLP